MIHQNLNLLINLDDDVQPLPFVNLPNEIWTLILNFLSLRDVILLKFLSKRFYRLSFLKKKLKYFSINSHKVFEVNEYYNMFFYFFNDLLDNLKMKFYVSTFLLLKYSLEDLKNQFMISNCLYHLLSCPRSVFARNDCVYCSRAYISSQIIQSKNFNYIANFNCRRFFNLEKLSTDSLNILKQFKILVFFKSLHEFSIFNSDRKRCLNTFIVQDYMHLVLVFFEIQLRFLLISFII